MQQVLVAQDWHHLRRQLFPTDLHSQPLQIRILESDTALRAGSMAQILLQKMQRIHPWEQ